MCCRTASSIWISTITNHIRENHNRSTYATTYLSNTCLSIRTPNEPNISIYRHAQPFIRPTTDFPLRANRQTRMNHPPTRQLQHVSNNEIYPAQQSSCKHSTDHPCTSSGNPTPTEAPPLSPHHPNQPPYLMFARSSIVLRLFSGTFPKRA